MIERLNEDGSVYYVVMEPSDPPRLQHDDIACGECSFVASADCIVVTRDQRRRATVTPGRALGSMLGLYDMEDTIVELGRFTLPGWTGHGAFWLFTCPECREQGVDYLHGHQPYLRCPSCAAQLYVTGDRFYKAAGLPKSPTRAQEFAYLRERRRQFGV